MYRILYILFGLLILSSDVGAVDYYVNPSTGNNSNAGTSSGSPVADLTYIDGHVADGDTVILTSSATSPTRHDYYMQIFNSITTKSSGSRSYVLGTIDISHGAAIGERMHNSTFHGWYGANLLWKYIALPSGTVTRDSTNYYSAPYSAALPRTTSDVALVASTYLEKATDYTLIYQHRESGEGMNLRLKIKRDSAEEYLARPAVSTCANNGSGAIRITTTQPYNLINGSRAIISGVTGTTEANGSWVISVIDTTHLDLIGSTFTHAYVSGGTVYTWASGTTSFINFENVIINANQSWLPNTILIPATEADQYNFTYRNATNSSTMNIDDISVLPNTANYSWSLFSGTTYKLDQTKGVQPTVMLKSTSTAWTASGVDALAKVTQGSGKSSLNAGEWAYDAGTIYYRLANGESDITAIHFEVSSMYATQPPPNDVDDLFSFSGANAVLSNIDIVGALDKCIFQTTGYLKLFGVRTRWCGGSAGRDNEISYSQSGWLAGGVFNRDAMFMFGF